MEYKLKWPDVKGRKEIKAIDVKYAKKKGENGLMTHFQTM